MSKAVNRGARIVFGGADISEYVTRWVIEGQVGELYVAELDIIDHPDAIEIEPDSDAAHSQYPRNDRDVRSAKGGAEVLHRGVRIPTHDKILIQGTDVSSWISGYDRKTRVGRTDIIRLYVQCDSEILSINNTTPWVDAL